MFFTKAIAAAIIFAAHAASQKAISLCGNPNFSACENVQYTINRCVNLTGFTRQTANSLDTYGATCRFYIADQCNAGSVRAASTQITGRNSALSDEFASKISSFSCSN